jgi:hypothetical protein
MGIGMPTQRLNEQKPYVRDELRRVADNDVKFEV